MTILTERKRTGQYIASEANKYRSREEVVVTFPTDGLEPGTVLGKITATGKYVAHDNALSNGGQNAVAVLFEGSSDAGDQNRTITARDSEVSENELIFKTGITDANKAAALVNLASVGIVAR